MYFILELKISLSELLVVAPLDFALPWHFSVGRVIGRSQFNLYTQAYAVFR